MKKNRTIYTNFEIVEGNSDKHREILFSANYEEIGKILEKGMGFEDRIRDIGAKFLNLIFTDGWCLQPFICLDCKDDIRRTVRHIQDDIDSLQEMAETFNDLMSAEGDEWKTYLSEDLAELPKEQVIRRFNIRYKRLMTDYEKLKPKLEELLKE